MKRGWIAAAWDWAGTLLLWAVGIAILVASVVVATKAVSISVTWNKKIPPGEAPIEPRLLLDGAQTDEVHEVAKDDTEEAVGTLRAANRSEVSSRVMARITKINVVAGQEVAKGDVLVLLDDVDLQAQLRQAQASLAAAEAERDQAEITLRRDASLVKTNAISQSQYDRSLSSAKVARNNVQRAQSAVAEAQKRLSDATIRASQAGVVVDRLAEPGNMAVPGQPLLVLYDPGSLRLEVPVVESLLDKIKRGDKVKVLIGSSKKEDENGKAHKEVIGTVEHIVPQAEAASRSFLVKIALPRSEGLIEGLFGRVEIPIGPRKHLCLAEAAIERIGQLEMVDVVVDGNRLQRRLIKTGRTGQWTPQGQPLRVEVLSGLDAKEKVLLRPDKLAQQKNCTNCPVTKP
ncbi:MAG: efflux RND transporter periplasmic adaptor subunit [Pirellulales bacterium]|nr:efflux RND transporter periplasmic adaptor subunit [Pirellulales bacterium]